MLRRRRRRRDVSACMWESFVIGLSLSLSLRCDVKSNPLMNMKHDPRNARDGDDVLYSPCSRWRRRPRRSRAAKPGWPPAPPVTNHLAHENHPPLAACLRFAPILPAGCHRKRVNKISVREASPRRQSLLFIRDSLWTRITGWNSCTFYILSIYFWYIFWLLWGFSLYNIVYFIFIFRLIFYIV